MAIIYTYPRLINPQDSDLLLISDASAKRKDTKRVELGDLATFINNKVDVGVTSIIAGAGVTVDQPTGDVTISATGGGSGGVGGAGTPQQIAMWDTTSSITDSIMSQNIANNIVSLNGSLEISNTVQTPTWEHLSAFNGFQLNKPTPGSTDTARKVLMNLGMMTTSVTGNSAFNYVLDLYTPNDLSDPINFSDAKAFRYQWNDAYTFIRLQAEDYPGGNPSPLWEVGDMDGESTGARWQVNAGGYARFTNLNNPAGIPLQTYFEVTTSLAKFGVELDMKDNKIVNVQDPTLPQDAATKAYVDSTTGGGSVGGTGTTDALPIWTAANTLGDSLVVSTSGGNGIGINMTPGAGSTATLRVVTAGAGGTPDVMQLGSISNVCNIMLDHSGGSPFGYYGNACVAGGLPDEMQLRSNKDLLFASGGNTEHMRLMSAGELQLPSYGSGTFTGTATFNLSVDANGNIIETAGALPYKLLSQKISQTGTNDPTVDNTFFNDTGSTFTWTRSGTGVYRISANQPTFTTGKTQVFLNIGNIQVNQDPIFISHGIQSTTLIEINTFKLNGTRADVDLQFASFAVHIYP